MPADRPNTALGSSFYCQRNVEPQQKKETPMRTKLLGIIAAIAFVSVFASSARAASGGTGKIISITIYNGTNFATVGFTNITGTRPSCHNASISAEYAFDLSTNKGKALLSLAQSAQLAGKTVGFAGPSTNTCTTVQAGLNIETLSIMNVLTN